MLAMACDMSTFQCTQHMPMVTG